MLNTTQTQSILPQKRGHKGLEIIIHLCVWASVFSFPLLFWSSQHSVTLLDFLRFVFMPICLSIVFYLNYGRWINRFLLQKKLGIFVVLNLVLIALLIISIYYWHNLIAELEHHLSPLSSHEFGRKGPSPLLFLARNSSLLMLTCGLSVAIRVTSNWYRTEMERQTLEKEKTEMVLKNLKSQLHPHFLFNTLNNIYALVEIDPGKAQQSIHSLSKLLRYVLKESDQNEISLSEEVIFMQNYIRLMSLRLGQHISLTVDFPSVEHLQANHDPIIAPLLFINLVENAFKHGTSCSENSSICVSLVYKEPSLLEFACSNTFSEQSAFSKEDTGIGIPNLRKRLDYLYPNHYFFENHKEGSTFFTSLKISLQS